MPVLHPFARDVNRERTLCADVNGARAEIAFAQFHQQRKFLKGAVEFRVDELVDGERVEWHDFPDARPFDDEVEHFAVHRPRGDLIDCAGAIHLFFPDNMDVERLEK